MSKNWIVPKMDKFGVLILCHERPYYNETFKTLKRSGYTGKIFIILDNLDKTIDDYINIYGNDAVYVFNKSWVAKKSDAMNNFGDMCATLFVRNATFDIAKDLNLDYFLVLDDDYKSFSHKREECEKTSKKLDLVFYNFVEYLVNAPQIKCLAFSQGGDHIGGYNPQKMFKRKAMNSFFCMTSRKFEFFGTLNDDVNCYLINGKRGDIFLTFMNFQLDQNDTQTTKGGMSETYQQMGTYLKSFTSIIASPSNVKIRMMGVNYFRLHHNIDWKTTAPMIISEDFKKSYN